MKKGPVVVVGAMALLFALITVARVGSRRDAATRDAARDSARRETGVREFWEVYRRATDARIAGNMAEARDRYRRALALDPRHEDALYYLGGMELELRHYQEAGAAWDRLVEVNPSSARAHSRLGDLYACLEPGAPRDLARAEREYRRASELNREETGPPLHLGELALVRGDLASAGQYFAAVLRTNPRSVEAHYLQGFVAWRRGWAESAAAGFGAAVKLARSTPPPVQQAPSEGDTKRGLAPAIAPTTTCRLVEPEVQALAQIDSTSASLRMPRPYRQLEARLAAARIATTPWPR